MKLTTRLAGAYALLSGRGNGAVVCSCCGQASSRVEAVIAGPGATAICNRCVFICNAVLLENSGVAGFARQADPPHRQTRSIQLAYDDVFLSPAERLALEPLLLTLVAGLPDCKLMGWQYSHAAGRFDLLTVEVEVSADIDATGLDELAKERWRAIRDSAGKTGSAPLTEAGQAALQAAQYYVEAVEACLRES